MLCFFYVYHYSDCIKFISFWSDLWMTTGLRLRQRYHICHREYRLSQPLSNWCFYVYKKPSFIHYLITHHSPFIVDRISWNNSLRLLYYQGYQDVKGIFLLYMNQRGTVKIVYTKLHWATYGVFTSLQCHSVIAWWTTNQNNAGPIRPHTQWQAHQNCSAVQQGFLNPWVQLQ